MENNIDRILQDGLYANWIASLSSYADELQNLKLTVQQLIRQSTTEDSIDLQNLERDISINLQFLEVITNEVNELRSRFHDSSEEKQLTMTEMFARNRVREKIRKLEQSCFMIKYTTNKYLQKVS